MRTKFDLGLMRLAEEIDVDWRTIEGIVVPVEDDVHVGARVIRRISVNFP